MLKKNKWKLLISSIVTLLPIVFGLVFWDKLPEQMVIHWGFDGNADGFSDRFFAVFALPIIMLVTQWLCIFITTLEVKNKNQNSEVFGLVIWIVPVVSLFVNGIVYSTAFGNVVSPYVATTLLMGTVFMAIGSCLPKYTQNYTIGIRVKWTLENEENWNATHRISGKIWFVGGLVLMACMFLPNFIIHWIVLPIIILLAIFPIIYSYFYYRKQLKTGKFVSSSIPKIKANKIVRVISVISVIVIIIFISFILFSGDIDIKYNEDFLVVESSFWDDIKVEYDDIKSIEYRDNIEVGLRTYGLGSARLLAGTFNNEEFGNYTRYSYTQCDVCVVLNLENKILVISGENEESTKAIYDKIKVVMEQQL